MGGSVASESPTQSNSGFSILVDSKSDMDETELDRKEGPHLLNLPMLDVESRSAHIRQAMSSIVGSHFG